MDSDERKWVEEAIALCANATRAQVMLLMIRRQDQNDGADVIVSNATTPEMVAALKGHDAEDDMENDEE